MNSEARSRRKPTAGGAGPESPSLDSYTISRKSSPSPTTDSFYIPSSSASKPTHIYGKSSQSKSKGPGGVGNGGFWDGLGGGLNIGKGESRVLAGLVLLGSVVRFWKLDRPASVVFDEVHFGGFANKYIQSRFFMDVHPPLAKLLLTAMAWASGFVGGSFDFKEIGRDYIAAGVPYVSMRMLPATLGLLLIPIAYLTLRALQTRPSTALLGALFIMFENGLITQSRLILLDSPLIFFTALTMFFWVGFSNENELARDRGGRVGPFSRRWWIWLTLTGLALGAVVSCKWVGLFTIATLGVLTIIQLWSLLGDLRVPMPLLAKHFAARAVCLIVLPVLFYMSMFAIHFAILNNSGEGDGFMSSEFQHTLAGHGMEDTFADVKIGSHITIRHLNTQGGYLHSHAATYPGGSKQQQVTLYPHRDDNNVWLILNTTTDDSIEDPHTHSPTTGIVDKQKIVFHHISTNKKLHSHDVRAPITEVDYQNEVSAYGFSGFAGDANDHFQIEFDHLTSDGSESKTHLQTLRTKFRLRHVLTGCYLFSHKTKLPEWGFEQQEVTCNKNPSKANGLWYIETNTHGALPADAKKVNYRVPSFFSKFFELQGVMWRTNAGLTDRHAYDSRPSTWPFLTRGINFWVKDHRQIYLIGNPFVWWLSSLTVLAYVAVRGLLILRAQRGYKDFSHSGVVHYDRLCGFLALGWFLHYFPFFLMSRQLFLHHYFPALYFAILLSACGFDLITAPLKPKYRAQVLGVIVLATVYTYNYFSPLAYAGVWTRSQCESAKWVKTWDFSCNDFHMSKSDYKHNTTPTTDAALSDNAEATTAPVGNGAAAAHDPFGEGGHSKAPKSDSIPEQPKMEAAVAPNDDVTLALSEGDKEKEKEATREVFAVPAALEATAEAPEESAEAVKEAPRNAEEKIELEKEEEKAEEKKEEKREEKKDVEEKKDEPKVVIVTVMVEAPPKEEEKKEQEKKEEEKKDEEKKEDHVEG